jgi:hypothetical protein
MSRARTIEAELDRRAGEAGYDSRLEVDLKVDDEVESALRHLRGSVRERAQSTIAIEDDDLVDRSMAAHQRRRTRLEHPGYPRGWVLPLQRIDHRQHVHRIAHRAHHHDADVVRDGWSRRAHSTLFRRRCSSSSAE